MCISNAIRKPTVLLNIRLTIRSKYSRWNFLTVIYFDFLKRLPLIGGNQLTNSHVTKFGSSAYTITYYYYLSDADADRPQCFGAKFDGILQV